MISKNNEPYLYKYFPMLDGIRAISILWVILHHLPIPLPAWLEFIRIRGDLGVELFFAVSGFLVTRSLNQCIQKAKEKNIKKVIIDFLIRRTSRVFPAYYLTLLALLLIGLLFDQSLLSKIKSISDIVFSFPLYLYNYFKFSTSGNIPGTLNIMWSLAFEEQFYLLLIATFFIFRKRFAYALGTIGIISIGWRLIQSFIFPETIISENQLQIQSHFRLDAIMWGCLAWIYYHPIVTFWKDHTKLQPFLKIIIVVSCLLAVGLHHKHHSTQWMSSVYILTAISFTLLITYLTLNPRGILTRLLSGKAITTIGIISYELYLLHEIIVGISVRLGLKSSPFAFLIVSYLFSIVAALALHYFFAKPVQKKIRRLFK